MKRIVRKFKHFYAYSGCAEAIFVFSVSAVVVVTTLTTTAVANWVFPDDTKVVLVCTLVVSVAALAIVISAVDYFASKEREWREEFEAENDLLALYKDLGQ